MRIEAIIIFIYVHREQTHNTVIVTINTDISIGPSGRMQLRLKNVGMLEFNSLNSLKSWRNG